MFYHNHVQDRYDRRSFTRTYNTTKEAEVLFSKFLEIEMYAHMVYR